MQPLHPFEASAAYKDVWYHKARQTRALSCSISSRRLAAARQSVRGGSQPGALLERFGTQQWSAAMHGRPGQAADATGCRKLFLAVGGWVVGFGWMRPTVHVNMNMRHAHGSMQQQHFHAHACTLPALQ